VNPLESASPRNSVDVNCRNLFSGFSSSGRPGVFSVLSPPFLFSYLYSGFSARADAPLLSESFCSRLVVPFLERGRTRVFFFVSFFFFLLCCFFCFFFCFFLFFFFSFCFFFFVSFFLRSGRSIRWLRIVGFFAQKVSATMRFRKTLLFKVLCRRGYLSKRVAFREKHFLGKQRFPVMTLLRRFSRTSTLFRTVRTPRFFYSAKRASSSSICSLPRSLKPCHSKTAPKHPLLRVGRPAPFLFFLRRTLERLPHSPQRKNLPVLKSSSP